MVRYKADAVPSEELSSYLETTKEAFWSGLRSWWSSARRDYPWRKPDISPYEVLVAEVLLKRTTATAAARVFPKLLIAYPEIRCLAEARLSDLETALSSVGLQKQRAESLVEIATYVCSKWGPKMPPDLEGLLGIPNIGPYSARAVLSFAFGIPVGVVDSNVERIVRRAFKGILPEKPGLHLVQAIVDSLLPQKEHKQFNWALLDLGAMVCRYTRPKCTTCPINSLCQS